jgi:hypothetical protein
VSSIYDRSGQPLPLLEGARLMEDREYRRIDETTLPNGIWVSTVWLGFNHSYFGGRPIIFETMVFGGTHTTDWRKLHRSMAKWAEDNGSIPPPDGLLGGERFRHARTDQDCARYSTEAEARLGHAQAVEKWKSHPGVSFTPRLSGRRIPRRIKKSASKVQWSRWGYDE